ncbi:hypothetical protein VTK73DRAFT_1808 [Phialemonium thermophilum]|uniref:non-specific serine/threonine protein kinase n=1 Tax=Phialemonium thermophilum TaxID=223376 RepID=A0ABR3X8Q0_9PEZI
MAPENAGAAGLQIYASGQGHVDHRPPPSTLAAQLVENISSAARSTTGPDETSELKRLLEVVEKVKNRPDLLRTIEERIEHNHMLIYICTRVALDGLKWDDPFASNARRQSEIVKAIQFLQVTVRETPHVLQFSTDGKSFLFRGCEPLWLWLLPRVLRILSSDICAGISPLIEEFCETVLSVACRDGYLWSLLPAMMGYLQANVAVIIASLREAGVSDDPSTFQLQLSSRDAAGHLQDAQNNSYSAPVSYPIRGVSAAMRHALCVLRVIRNVAHLTQLPNAVGSFQPYVVWLADSIFSLFQIRCHWHEGVDLPLSTLTGFAIGLVDGQEESRGYDRVISQKMYNLLVLFCSEMVTERRSILDSSEEARKIRMHLCKALIQLSRGAIEHRPVSSLVKSQLLSPMLRLSLEAADFAETTDLGRAIVLLREVTATSPPFAFGEHLLSDSFSDSDLRERVASLNLRIPTEETVEPQLKRRRLIVETCEDALSNLTDILHDLLPSWLAGGLAGLESNALEGFPKLNDREQCTLIATVSRLQCAADGTLNIINGEKGPQRLRCRLCSSGVERSHNPDGPSSGDVKSVALATFSSLLQAPSFSESKRPRIVAMMSLKRILRHCGDLELWDLEKSIPGQWCLQSLQSSLRELRLAAGRVIALFVGGGVAPDAALESTLKRNRINALAILRTLSDKDTIHIHETCIAAWGQVGRVVPDEELNLVLIKLIEYLGHSHRVLSAFAFNEILGIARSLRSHPRQLFAPFWRNIAYFVVKDLISRPQTARLVAELLQISVTELLRLVQVHALPWLVLTKKREVIKKIAEARGDADVWETCCDSANLGAILSLLLVQDVPNIEDVAMSLFRSISPHFDRFSLVELLGSEPLLTALELFKASGEADTARKSRIREALTFMASLLSGSKGRTLRKEHHLLGRYFEQHALGLTARLSEVINDSLGLHPPVQEQRRCIMAMEEMITVCRTYVRIARPQISASIMSALAYDDLRPAAFSCWTALLTNMEDEDVEVLLQPTFFVVDHYWTIFDEMSKKRCTALVQRLIDDFGHVLRNSIDKLPSLSHIDGLVVQNNQLEAMRKPLDNGTMFSIFAHRLSHENSGVVLQTLDELVSYLGENQAYIQAAAMSEKPDSVVLTLFRALLDCATKYNGLHSEIVRLCAECIGLAGCIDSNRVDTPREQKQFVVVENFNHAGETTDFVLFMLENVLVKAFLSATDTRFIGFLSYVMQELLDKCDFRLAYAQQGKGDSAPIYRKWLGLSDTAKEVLSPLLTSGYILAPMSYPEVSSYPIFQPGRSYVNWLRPFVLDLLRNGQNPFSQTIFAPLQRVIRVKEVSIAEFLLPYLVVHVVVEQDRTTEFSDKISTELLAILNYEAAEHATYVERENVKRYYEAVFRILDYALRWMQLVKTKHGSRPDFQRRVSRLQRVLDAIDPELICKRAIDCKQYARALFHLEPFIWRKLQSDKKESPDSRRLMKSLQDIYVEIDDPDGLEGILAHQPIVSLDEQILSHRKAGRWTATQSWYEIRLAECPDNVDVQLDLLTCLKESGQHDILLNYVEGMNISSNASKIIPFAVEASWATGRWDTLEKYLQHYDGGDSVGDFNLGVAQSLLCLRRGQLTDFKTYIRAMRDQVASSLTDSTTASLQACHGTMLKCHVLTDLEMIADWGATKQQQTLQISLDRRLEVIGAYVNDKQYLLSIRRAAMELTRPRFGDGDISSAWLSSARLARKSGSMHQSFNAVLHALQLNDGSATIEHARLLWRDGHHRKAIQMLKSAIENDSFMAQTVGSVEPKSSKSREAQRNLLTARAHLLLAKWQDSAGQTNAKALRDQYQLAAKTHAQWEKGHYYLGRHYKKVLESQKALQPDDQSDAYLTGEIAKLVIENYLRSLLYGAKYLYQTLPRVLTLWLDLGAQLDKPPEGKVSFTRELYTHRVAILREIHACFSRYLQKLPAYIFYTALPQLVARIAHPNSEVFAILEKIIVKVVEAHPRQALWSLFACMTTKQPIDRKTRGIRILHNLRSMDQKVDSGHQMRHLLRMGEKLAEQLLLACNNGDFQSNRTTMASITRDLNFNHKCTPCPLVVPIEACLTATLPTLTGNVRKHEAFSRDVITIDSFLDDVLVLGSLAKPRKLTARGSDGRLYGLLIKPKDDLRTDQRLMEFNSMINRSLKRDAESSRRQLYIRTYAVTPLNEECGIIEWVEGLKTLRDILLAIYKARGIIPNYGNIAQLMKDAAENEKNLHLFTDTVLGLFPPVLPEWFINQFPNPSAWFAARLRYTRSCAVMSMVGTILGLGDRHGENVLLEEGNGGVFHVDFNCLFDKGLTFAQPERVPFRLTHNMVAAMGIYGYEGPFRQCSELTLRILRQQEETLMTILEAFIYDPTLDLQRDKKRKVEVVKLKPTSVVESIRRKVRGLLPKESIPLGVEGQVEELIGQAVDPKNLTAMYIGWCPFL